MSDPDTYRTLADRSSAAFAVEGSKFVSHAAPVENVDAAEVFNAEIEAANDDTTPNVPAYRVRADPSREYASDDGEPSGSA